LDGSNATPSELLQVETFLQQKDKCGSPKRLKNFNLKITKNLKIKFKKNLAAACGSFPRFITVRRLLAMPKLLFKEFLAGDE
jgi:hypothetical protein